MKAAVGIVVALIAGCAIGYGVAMKMPKAGIPGAMMSTPGSNEALFQYDGKNYTENELPTDVQTSLYEFRRDAHQRMGGLLNQFALRLDLAKKAGRDKEVPLPELEALLDVPKPDEADVKKLYEANKDRLPPNTSFEQIKPDIEKYLTNQKMSEALQAKAAEFAASKKFVPLMAEPQAPQVTIDTSKFASSGNKDAKIVVVEVADYLCPHCQAVQPEVEETVASLSSQIRFHPVPFSLRITGLSGQLARGAQCALKQGEDKFWAWHKTAFATAKSKGWKTSDPESMDHVKEILGSIQLDNNAFEACIDAPETKAAVEQLVKTMNGLGVNGTPTFFVNGRRMDLHSGFKDELEKHLKGSSH